MALAGTLAGMQRTHTHTHTQAEENGVAASEILGGDTHTHTWLVHGLAEMHMVVTLQRTGCF